MNRHEGMPPRCCQADDGRGRTVFGGERRPRGFEMLLTCWSRSFLSLFSPSPVIPPQFLDGRMGLPSRRALSLLASSLSFVVLVCLLVGEDQN